MRFVRFALASGFLPVDGENFFRRNGGFVAFVSSALIQLIYRSLILGGNGRFCNCTSWVCYFGLLSGYIVRGKSNVIFLEVSSLYMPLDISSVNVARWLAYHVSIGPYNRNRHYRHVPHRIR